MVHTWIRRYLYLSSQRRAWKRVDTWMSIISAPASLYMSYNGLPPLVIGLESTQSNLLHFETAGAVYFTAYFAPPVPNDTTSNLLFSIEWWPNSEFCINNSFIISLMASNVCGFSLKQIIFFFFWERVFNLLHHFIIRSKH